MGRNCFSECEFVSNLKQFLVSEGNTFAKKGNWKLRQAADGMSGCGTGIWGG